MSENRLIQPEELAALAHYASARSLTHLEYSDGKTSFEMSLAPNELAPAQAPEQPDSTTIPVKAASPGHITLLRELVPGALVKNGEIIAAVEAGDVRMPIVCATSGTVASVEAVDQQFVSYGTFVAAIIPNGA